MDTICGLAALLFMALCTFGISYWSEHIGRKRANRVPVKKQYRTLFK